MKRSIPNTPALVFFLATVIIAVGCTMWDASFYSKILGPLDPIITFSLSGVAAWLALIYVKRFDLYFIGKDATTRVFLYYFTVSLLLGLMPVLMDLLQRFPEDINVLLPESLLFYPTIGVLADILFHLLPTTLMLLLFRSHIKKHPWIIILLMAMVEPVFQVGFLIDREGLKLWDVLLFLEVFVFGVFQMYAFLKHGFLAMFLCRMGFYLTWHFIWGSIRLGWI